MCLLYDDLNLYFSIGSIEAADRLLQDHTQQDWQPIRYWMSLALIAVLIFHGALATFLFGKEIYLELQKGDVSHILPQ